MTKTVYIDGKAVPLRASAGVPRLYRLKFKRDIIQDMGEIDRAVKGAKNDENGGSTMPIEALTMFENVAYIMARHAAPNDVPDTVDEWLDGFETFSVYAVFPEIMELWRGNMEQLAESKKK